MTSSRARWLLLVCAAALWVAAIVMAPAYVTGGVEPAPGMRTAAALTYLAGGRVCHQRPDRSFSTAGIAWPVCGRCAALYASGLAGLLLAGRRPSGSTLSPAPYVRTALGIAAVPTACSLVVEWAGLADPGTLLRAVCALPLGAALGWTLGAAVLSSADGRAVRRTV